MTVTTHPFRARLFPPFRLSLGLMLSATAVAAPSSAQEREPPPQAVAVYQQGLGDVANAMTAILVERNELPASMAEAYTTHVAAAVEAGETTRMSSGSVAIGRAELERLIPAEQQRYLNAAGGRYVLNVTMEPMEGGGTRVTIVPTIIATVPEAYGPMGGRVLRSNGTLEAEIFEAMAGRFGG
ncbi:MAG: hypothetical protein JSU87_14595 [Gemmatimonadota bacterium]|nr:MAG: hypothetical protein JSU87_14595 [Gemmatimonadota bacterium]